MAKLIYSQNSESKKQVSAFLHSKDIKKWNLIEQLQVLKRKKIKQLKWSVTLNIALIIYVIIRGIYG